MARIDAGTYRARVEPVSPAELLRAAAKHLSVVAESRPVVIEVASDCPDVLTDVTLSTEILTNLLDNAHRASPPGDPILLDARSAGSGRVVLEVVDRGPGLDLNDHRWTHGLPVPVEDLPRRGLGLEIARTFAAASGGIVTIRRRHGTIAALDLPAAGEETEDEA
jgi:signal transduction histidine kinase